MNRPIALALLALSASLTLPLASAAGQTKPAGAERQPSRTTLKPAPKQPANPGVVAPAKPSRRTTPTTQPLPGVQIPDLRLTVLHNNDGESNVLPIATGPAAGAAGLARFVTLVNQEKSLAVTPSPEANAVGVVMISSGDNILPGANFNANDTLPPGAPLFDSLALQLIGYDGITLGNHDFDLGPAALGRLIAGVNVPPSGPFLSSNLNFSAEPALAPFTAGTTPRLARSVVRNVAGRLVGIVGATTTDLPFISSPGPNIAINLNVAQALQAEIDALDAAGVKIIIVSTHLQGFSTEIAAIAQLRKVDAVISGGGSELFATVGTPLLPGDVPNAGGPTLGGTGYPRFIRDADNNLIPAVTTSGLYRYLGRLVLNFDAQGNLLSVAQPISRPLPVLASITPDAAALAQVEQPVANYIAGLAQNIAALTSVTLDGRNISASAGIRAQETNVGNLFADSLLWQATVLAAQLGTPVPDVAFQNGGGIRNDVLITPGPGGTATVSENDLFRMAAFNNVLAVVPNVAPERLKLILENAVSRYPGGGASTAGNGRWAQIAGMQVVFDPRNTSIAFDQTTGAVTRAGNRIRQIILNDGRVIVDNGVVVPGAPSVNIATIDFLVASAIAPGNGLGGDQYPFGTDATFLRLGVTYQRALSNYLRTWLGGSITPANYPAGGERRIINLAP
ncbi:MAG: bifunctional metallophosphatase/5'-nucleotidase [Planctomycetaceae bacterium]|jgi:5'-nucleotidase|nr:bifunctional metallophosphatase/5'-nucleotidase [Planctomycetaceae bacterium]